MNLLNDPKFLSALTDNINEFFRERLLEILPAQNHNENVFTTQGTAGTPYANGWNACLAEIRTRAGLDVK